MDGKNEMITPTLPLERINEAFDLMHAGESIRGVVVCRDPSACRPGSPLRDFRDDKVAGV